MYRSLPLRSNAECGASRMRRYRSPDGAPPPPMLAFARDPDARAVADAGRNPDIDGARVAVVLRSRAAASCRDTRLRGRAAISCSTSRPCRRARAPRGPRASPASLPLPRRRRRSGRNPRTGRRCRTSRASRPRSSCGSRRPGPPPKSTFQATALWPAPPAPACSYIRQFAPSSSYFLRFSGSPRTSYASLISLNFDSADLSPGLTSGWCLRASFRNACLISLSVAVFAHAERRVVVLEVHRSVECRASAISSSSSCARRRASRADSASSRISGRMRCDDLGDRQQPLNAREVDAAVVDETLDRLEPLELLLRVEPHAADRAARLHEPESFVLPERLRMHAEHPGGHADEVEVLVRCACAAFKVAPIQV